MRSRRGIGVLPIHELKRVYFLGLEVVSERNPVMVLPGLIEARSDRIVVDLLWGVGVESSIINVGAVGKLSGKAPIIR